MVTCFPAQSLHWCHWCHWERDLAPCILHLRKATLCDQRVLSTSVPVQLIAASGCKCESNSSWALVLVVGKRKKIAFCEVSISDTCTSAAEMPQGSLILITWEFFLTIPTRMVPVAVAWCQCLAFRDGLTWGWARSDWIYGPFPSFPLK